jgi:hypothetical protein
VQELAGSGDMEHRLAEKEQKLDMAQGSDGMSLLSSNEGLISVPASSPSNQQTVCTLLFSVIKEDTPVFWKLTGAIARWPLLLQHFARCGTCHKRFRELFRECNSNQKTFSREELLWCH